MSLLDEITARLSGMTPEARAEIEREAIRATQGRKFIPSPGPQTEAYFSPADVLLFGGAGGGGKSSLIAGLALEEHRRTLMVRKHYSDLEKGGGLIDEVLKFHGSRDGFRGGTQALLRHGDGRVITFGGVNNPGDEEKYQGQPRDLLAVDEATQMRERAVRFLMGWVRSEVQGQRTRSILATNPPLSAQGQWIIGMFRPWLDLTHPNPAKPGELRWYVTDPDGNDMEVPGPEPYRFPGADYDVLPQSRTFIPSLLSDNPFLNHDTKYRAVQDAMPEPYRSAIRDGNFMAARQDDQWQAIPTAWVLEAQARWTPEPPQHAPMSAIAADIAQGGKDNTVIAPRYDAWFAPLVSIPGTETPTGDEVAGRVLAQRRNGAAVVLDMGGGYGGGAMMRMRDNGIEPVIGHKGAEAATARTKDGTLGFANKRSWIIWKMREDLDPSQDGGSPVALPPDPELVADLTAPTFEVTKAGIKVESKESVVDRIGRSTDRGDAVCMANAYGPRLQTHGNLWRGFGSRQSGGSSPRVNNSHSAARRRR